MRRAVMVSSRKRQALGAGSLGVEANADFAAHEFGEQGVAEFFEGADLGLVGLYFLKIWC